MVPAGIMSATAGAVSVLSVLSVHGVPMLIRCVGSAAPPRREVVGILNAVFQSVRQQALGTSGEGAGRDAVECGSHPPYAHPHHTLLVPC